MNKIEIKTGIQSLIEKLEESRNFLNYGYFTSQDEVDLDSLKNNMFSGLTFDEFQKLKSSEIELIKAQGIERLEQKRKICFSSDFDIDSMINDINNANVSEDWKNEPAKEALDDIHETCDSLEKLSISDIVNTIDKILDSLNLALSAL